MIHIFLKICVMALVMASAVLTGRQIACGYRKRLLELDALRRCMMILNNEIAYSSSALAECFDAASARCIDKEISEMFADMSRLVSQAQGERASDIWDSCVNRHEGSLHLTDTDIAELYNFGKSLGYLNAQMQTDSIRLYMSVLETQISDAAAHVDNQCRAAKTLSIACGAFVCIILI